jgi:hypothetical protein
MRVEMKPVFSPTRLILFLFLTLSILATPLRSFAQQSVAQKENRFLFVINTSSNMRRFTNGVLQTVSELLRTKMEGQMHDGDTFGIWTYDDELHTDFPMQVWSDRHASDVALSVFNFLSAQKYKNREHLEKVLPTLRQTIAASSVLTVIFIYDGTETMQGTGFDKQINDQQEKVGRDLRNHYIPFVTLLATWNGKPIDFSVNSPDKISVPQTADLIKPPQTNTAPVTPPVLAVTPITPTPAVIPTPHIEIVLTNPAKPTVMSSAAAAAEANALLVATSNSIPDVLSNAVSTQTIPPSTTSNSPVSPPVTIATSSDTPPSTPTQTASVTVSPTTPLAPPVAAPIALPEARTAIFSGLLYQIALLVIAVSLAVIAVSLVLLLLRRPQSNPPPPNNPR